MTPSSVLLQRIKALLVKPPSTWVVILSFVGGYVLVEREIQLEFAKNLEAERVGRYVRNLDRYHEELLVQANAYVTAVHHSHDDESQNQLRNGVRDTIIRLSQTVGNWENMLDGEMHSVIQAYDAQLGYLQREISSRHDEESIVLFLKRLSDLIQARRGLTSAIDNTYLNIED